MDAFVGVGNVKADDDLVDDLACGGHVGLGGKVGGGVENEFILFARLCIHLLDNAPLLVGDHVEDCFALCASSTETGDPNVFGVIANYGV